MLYREPKLLKEIRAQIGNETNQVVSVLYREPKLLKGTAQSRRVQSKHVSVLYREPKLLKAAYLWELARTSYPSFSALP